MPDTPKKNRAITELKDAGYQCRHKCLDFLEGEGGSVSLAKEDLAGIGFHETPSKVGLVPSFVTT